MPIIGDRAIGDLRHEVWPIANAADSISVVVPEQATYRTTHEKRVNQEKNIHLTRL